MIKKIHKILLIEDKSLYGTVLAEYLESCGYKVYSCTNADDGLMAFANADYDLCIINITILNASVLPVKMRKTNGKVPFIIIIPKEYDNNKTLGFISGFDECITKPFNNHDLNLMISSMNGRINNVDVFNAPADNNTNVFLLGKVFFDSEIRTLKIDNNEFRLTRKENDLLKLFCTNRERLLLRKYILESVWGDDDYFSGRSMDVYITKLRKYLKDEPRLNIKNVHGTGYIFNFGE